ncbi:CHAP domain-containing protein [Galbitalea sp. SE-J8]|uniref:CHAP domain-containing protein n=1 Tax=Galbitalea sp. SE-J8 TaxID=3054952 RepID=UPI00259C89C1|nr:CHAP domain-containing protein [Galbitalea sp. SE-J8]MDM4761454.1 CHAP domain-containing protein [Galbitalea sp. SE-J8]
MHHQLSKRALAAALATIALAVGTLVAGAPAASAALASAPTSAVLCQGYAGCTALGMTNHGYSTRTAGYWRMVPGHNCTNYAAFLLIKAGASRTRPWTGNGNANAWGHYLPNDAVPSAGAIAWWDANTNGSGAAGHVAFVEAVLSPTTIVVSEDNYGGDFYWKVITAADPHWPTGFIHRQEPGLAAGVAAWSGRFVDQTMYTDATLTTPLPEGYVKPGATAWVNVRYQNLGSAAWVGTSLGTPFDPAPPIASGWPTPDRVGQQREASVDIGGIASYVFAVQAPAGVPDGTTSSTVLQPVSPASGWMPGGKATLGFVTDSRDPFTVAPPPTLAGAAREGQTLTASVGAWAPVVPSIAFQWTRDGVAIPGANTWAYTLTAADVTHRVALAITGSADGYIPVTQSSAPTAVVASRWPSSLTAGGRTVVGQQLVSANGVYRAGVTTSGKIAVVNRLTAKVAWSTRKIGAVKLKLRSDGNLVAYARSGRVVWQSKTKKSKAVRLGLSTTGKLVLYTSAGKQKWKTTT